MNEVKYYICKKCGNLVKIINEGAGQLTCCGAPMERLESNVIDASLEKHVPIIKKENGILTIEVGSVYHPMLEEHYIMWVHVITKDGTVYKKDFKPGDEPKALFEIKDLDGAEVYAYCNIHGLWKTIV